MVVFTLLGLVVGVAGLDAVGHDLGIGAAIYIAITQLISLAAGGFAAARFMRSGDMLTGGRVGAAVWALVTLVVASGGLNTGTAAISSFTSLVAQAAQSGANTVQGTVASAIHRTAMRHEGA